MTESAEPLTPGSFLTDAIDPTALGRLRHPPNGAKQQAARVHRDAVARRGMSRGLCERCVGGEHWPQEQPRDGWSTRGASPAGPWDYLDIGAVITPHRGDDGFAPHAHDEARSAPERRYWPDAL